MKGYATIPVRDIENACDNYHNELLESASAYNQYIQKNGFPHVKHFMYESPPHQPEI